MPNAAVYGTPSVVDGIDALRAREHVALCTGPYQFISLLLAWRAAEVDLGHARVLYMNSSDDPSFREDFLRVADRFGVRADHVDTQRRVGRRAGRDIVYWYTRAIAVSLPAFTIYRRLSPRRVVQYYDSYHTALGLDLVRRVAPDFTTRPTRLLRSLKDVLAVRALEPDLFVVPDVDADLWARCADETQMARTLLSDDSERLDLLLQADQRINSADEAPDHAAPGKRTIYLAVGVLAERNPGISVEAEIDCYVELALRMRGVAPDLAIAIKLHPRASHAKHAYARRCADRLGATLVSTNRFLEALLPGNEVDGFLVSGPSVALLNTRRFGLAFPVCLGESFFVGQFGDAYRVQQRRGKRVAEGHGHFVHRGIAEVDSALDLERCCEDWLARRPGRGRPEY
jgi:hypothetical protein